MVIIGCWVRGLGNLRSESDSATSKTLGICLGKNCDDEYSGSDYTH